jgi:HTH-like domain
MLAGHLARLIDDHTWLNHAQRLRTLADMAVAEQLEEGPLRQAKGRGLSPPLEPTTPHGANRLSDRPPGDSQFSSASSNRDRKSDTPSGLRRSSPQSANRCPPAITVSAVHRRHGRWLMLLWPSVSRPSGSSRADIGAPRIHAMLARDDIRVGRKRVERLMRQAGIQGAHLHKRSNTTWQDKPDAAKARRLRRPQGGVDCWSTKWRSPSGPTATSCQVRHSHRRPGVVGRQQSRLVAGLRGGHGVSRVSGRFVSAQPRASRSGAT